MEIRDIVFLALVAVCVGFVVVASIRSKREQSR
jgi:hypothetical protein